MSENKSYTSKNPAFKYLQELGENKSDEFEVKRNELINEFLVSIPEKYQQGMHCLQWRINQTRDIAKTPMSACIEISKMMFTSVGNLQSQAYSMQQGLKGEAIQAGKKTATILAFTNTNRRGKLLVSLK